MRKENDLDVIIEPDEIAVLLGKSTSETNKREAFTKRIKVSNSKTNSSKTSAPKKQVLTKEEVAFLLGNNKKRENREQEIGE